MGEKAKKEEIDLKDLAKWSGEDTVRRYRFTVPILKFNGNTGKFSLLTPDDSGKWVAEPIKKKDIEIVVLKVRRVLSSYEKLPDGSGLRTFTNEHNSWRDELTVFEMKKGDSKPRMIDSGSSQDVRKRFPTLRLRQNLYCWYNNNVVKLTARGKSLSALFGYYQDFKAQEHIFQFITKLGCHSETNEGGLTYYVIDWERGDESDLPFIAEKIKEVKESLDLQDKQYAEISGVPQEDRQEKAGDIKEAIEPEEVIPEVKKESKEADEVQVEDIPT